MANHTYIKRVCEIIKTTVNRDQQTVGNENLAFGLHFASV